MPSLQNQAIFVELSSGPVQLVGASYPFRPMQDHSLKKHHRDKPHDQRKIAEPDAQSGKIQMGDNDKFYLGAKLPIDSWSFSRNCSISALPPSA
jgi:hypothetical protein